MSECPHCGAPRDPRSSTHSRTEWQCGTWSEPEATIHTMKSLACQYAAKLRQELVLQEQMMDFACLGLDDDNAGIWKNRWREARRRFSDE